MGHPATRRDLFRDRHRGLGAGTWRQPVVDESPSFLIVNGGSDWVPRPARLCVPVGSISQLSCNALSCHARPPCPDIDIAPVSAWACARVPCVACAAFPSCVSVVCLALVCLIYDQRCDV